MTINTTKAAPHVINYERILKIYDETTAEMLALLKKFYESCMGVFYESVSQLPSRSASPGNTPRSLAALVTPPSPPLSETILSTVTAAERALEESFATSEEVPAIPDNESARALSSRSSSPVNTPRSLTPEATPPSSSLPETMGAAETAASEAASPIANGAAALTLQGTNLVHKTANLTWGSYIYTVEQDLPATTTDQEWEQIVKAYEDLLNNSTSSADCHAGIEKLSLSLDKDQGTMHILVPDETPDPSHPEKRNKTILIESTNPEVQGIVDFLTSVLTKTGPLEMSRTLNESEESREPEEPESADTAETAPASEVIESREIIPLFPPLKLRNPTKTLCYLNSLIQMIMASPHLQAQFMKSPILQRHLASYSTPERPGSDISSLNSRNLDLTLYPRTDPMQRDLLETLWALVDELPVEETRKFKVVKSNTKAFCLTREGSDFESFSNKHSLLPVSTPEQNIYVQNTYEPSLPLLSVNPNETISSLSETIQQQHCEPQIEASGDRSMLTSGEAGGTQFTLMDQISQFTTTPQTLFIHTNRRNLTDTSINSNGINLEETLLLPGSLFSQEGDTIHYELRSFTVHEGTDSRQGHYISYVRIPGKDNQSRYYKLDDLKPEENAEITKEQFLLAAQKFTLAAFDLTLSEEKQPEEPNTENPPAASVPNPTPKAKSPQDRFYQGPVNVPADTPSSIEELDDEEETN